MRMIRYGEWRSQIEDGGGKFICHMPHREAAWAAVRLGCHSRLPLVGA